MAMRYSKQILLHCYLMGLHSQSGKGNNSEMYQLSTACKYRYVQDEALMNVTASHKRGSGNKGKISAHLAAACIVRE